MRWEPLRDVHLALRTLRKNPGFTTVAVLTLALGIGATTAVFTLIQQVMLRPLPVAEPDRLWRVGDAVRCCYSTGYAQSSRHGAPAAAVISFHAWEAKYGSDPDVVGAMYQINGRPFTIIGIEPPRFFGAKAANSGMPDFWLPLTTEPLTGATSRLENPGVAWLDLIGRVRPDTNPGTLEAQLQVELREWLASHAADMAPGERAALEKQTVRLTPGGAGVSLMRETYRDDLRLLLLAAISVLLEHQDFGFELSGRYLVRLNTMLSGYKQEQLVPVFREIEERLHAIQGVRMAQHGSLRADEPPDLAP